MYKIPGLSKFKTFVVRDNWLQRVRNFSFLIGEGALDLGVNLIVMIMVERFLGEAGLGVFAYLLSILMFAGFIQDSYSSGQRQVRYYRRFKNLEKNVSSWGCFSFAVRQYPAILSDNRIFRQ